MNPTPHEIPKIEETTASCSMENLKTSNDFTSLSKLGDSLHFANCDDNDSDKETEANSFIILGKDSLDAIQASSLASYVDIQQKSMLVDYNTMVSSLTTNEIHQKLTELLQENAKLKETLKQNNLAMKRQLTTMVLWQDMVTKLHENHMGKFKETTNLISDLKKENLELKTKLSMQQTENTEHNYEAIVYPTPNLNNSNTCEAVPQKLETSESSSLEKETYALPNDHKSNLAMPQTETIKCNLKSINTVPNSDKNIFTSEILAQKILSHTSSVPEEQKYALSNIPSKQHICQCSCKNSLDCYTNTCHFEKENTKQKVLKEESLLQNCEKQIPCEYNMSDKDLVAKLEESNLKVDQIHELILSIDKHKMNPVYWNDRDYEDNRIRYNNLISELVKNYIEVVNRCKSLTVCSGHMMTIFSEIEKAINAATFEKNLELLKEQIVKYRIGASVYNKLICRNDSTDHLIHTFSDALKNVQEHMRDVFVDYWENINMVYLIMDETFKMTDAPDNDLCDNSQKQTEVQQKLKMLAIQQSKMQKQGKELEERMHELNLQQESLNDEKRRIREVDILHEQLMRRKNLYDGKVRALLNERLLLMRDQKIDSTDLLEKYKLKNMDCERLQRELDQTNSEINVYKSQMSVYEEDFKQERNLKESLLEEKHKLDAELQKQVNYNKQLTNNLSSTARSVSEHFSSNNEVMPPCPKCKREFATLQSLTEHIEQCLNLT